MSFQLTPSLPMGSLAAAQWVSERLKWVGELVEPGASVEKRLVSTRARGALESDSKVLQLEEEVAQLRAQIAASQIENAVILAESKAKSELILQKDAEIREKKNTLISERALYRIRKRFSGKVDTIVKQFQTIDPEDSIHFFRLLVIILPRVISDLRFYIPHKVKTDSTSLLQHDLWDTLELVLKQADEELKKRDGAQATEALSKVLIREELPKPDENNPEKDPELETCEISLWWVLVGHMCYRRSENSKKVIPDLKKYINRRILPAIQSYLVGADMKLYQEALIKIGYTDVLTQLNNRRAFMDFTQELAQKKTLTKAAISIIDIDDFKKYNKDFGHAGWDAALQNFSRILEKSLPAGCVLSRLWGEEFAIFFPNMDQKEAYGILEKLRIAVSAQPFKYKKWEKVITASFGVFSYNPQELSIDDALENADRANYYAKKLGKNRVICYDPNNIEMQESSESSPVRHKKRAVWTKKKPNR